MVVQSYDETFKVSEQSIAEKCWFRKTNEVYYVSRTDQRTFFDYASYNLRFYLFSYFCLPPPRFSLFLGCDRWNGDSSGQIKGFVSNDYIPGYFFFTPLASALDTLFYCKLAENLASYFYRSELVCVKSVGQCFY